MPPLDILISLSVTVFGLAVAPSSKMVRWVCGFTLIVYQAYIALRHYPPTTPRFEVYQNGLSSSINLLAYFDHAIINDARINEKKKGQLHPFAQMTLLQRLKWSADIMLTNRGVNWSWEVLHLRRSTRARWSFVGHRFLRMIVCILGSDVLRFLCEMNPALQINMGGGSGLQGFAWQIGSVVVFWLSVASMQTFGYSLLAMVAVTLGVCEPQDWPLFYGPLSSVKSIRLFWGRVWHQLLRRPLQAHGRYISNDVLGLNPKGNLSSYTQLYIAFFLSGLVHAMGDWAVSKVFQDGWTTLVYYMSQAVVITLEDGVIALGRAVGIRRIPSLASYVWVIFWMGLLVPIWGESVAERGIKFEPPVSFVSPSQIQALFS